MTPTRRDILKAAAAAALAPAALGAEAPPLAIVDTHQHLWDLDRFHLPWLDRAGPLLKRNFLMAEYLKAVEGLNVTRAVYMEVEVAPDQLNREADWIKPLRVVTPGFGLKSPISLLSRKPAPLTMIFPPHDCSRV